jgi:hypothetical protein
MRQAFLRMLAILGVAVAAAAALTGVANADDAGTTVLPWGQHTMLSSMVEAGNVTAHPDGTVTLDRRDDGIGTQRWTAEMTIIPGAYYLKNESFPGKCLDVMSDDPATAGAQITTRPCEKSFRQTWVLAFDPSANWQARLVNYKSKLVVTVANDGTKVQKLVQAPNNPADKAQLFWFFNCTACG